MVAIMGGMIFRDGTFGTTGPRMRLPGSAFKGSSVCRMAPVLMLVRRAPTAPARTDWAFLPASQLRAFEGGLGVSHMTRHL